MNLIELFERFPTEDAARDFLKNVRWPDGVECPKCQCKRISELSARRQFTCLGCRHRFSVTSGTVMHSSKLPLRKWLLCIFMLADARKSISACQIGRQLKISVKRAWHLCHRVRTAMKEDYSQAALFRGIVQADDYYHGGQPRPEERGKIKRGRGSQKKQPIVGIVESSSGRVRTAVVENTGRNALRETLEPWLDLPNTELHTDCYHGYKSIGQLANPHKTVDHSVWYVAADGAHCNAVENAWSLLSRASMGTFHKISRKHLHRYLSEFDSRFNSRRDDVGEFMERIIAQGSTRTLGMKELVQ